MPECLSFWRRHLVDGEEEIENNHSVVWFQMRGEIPGAPQVLQWPGKWMQAEAEDVGKQTMILRVNDGGKLVNSASFGEKSFLLPFSTEAGERRYTYSL